MAEKIIVEMTREQAYAVMNATELLARLHIGQFNRITELLVDFSRPGACGRRDTANIYLEQACRAIYGVNQYGWPNIEEKTIEHERCWAVYATIRHALAWHDKPEGNPWSVAFDKPMGYGETMPKCEVRDDD